MEMAGEIFDALTYDSWTNWLNNNQGVLSLGLFVISVAFAWFSGIISALRRKPKLIIRVTPGPTLCTIMPTGRESNGHPTHRTCISLYLHISNAGWAPTSIGNIMSSYRWAVPRFTKIWWSQMFRPHRITFQTMALSDFHVSIGEDDIKFFPFLTQRSVTSGDSANTYLRIGDKTNGVVYFEDAEAWGSCRPVEQQGHTRVRVEIEDGFGHKHRQTVTVPIVAIEEAKKYNPRFGQSRETVSVNNNAD